MVDIKNQFDSCSYQELTECVKYRIAWLREFYSMRKNEALKDYPKIQAGLILSAVIKKSEIKRLLKMRRILKKSQLKNWNSDVLSVGG